MDPQGCPTSSPPFVFAALQQPSGNPLSTSSVRPQPRNHLNYQRITFPWPQQLAQHETPGRISDPLDAKLESGWSCCSYSAPEQERLSSSRRSHHGGRSANVVLLLILTLVWVMGANKTSLLSATQRVFGLPCGSAGKESACKVGDLGSITGLGRSPGEGNSYPLEYSGLENSMGCIDHGIAESNMIEWLASSLSLHQRVLRDKCDNRVSSSQALCRPTEDPHSPPLTPPRGAICRIAHRAPSNARSYLCAPLLQFLG